MPNTFQTFIGIDWGSEKHRVCIVDREGALVDQRWIEHNGNSLAEWVAWLRNKSSGSALLSAPVSTAEVVYP